MDIESNKFGKKVAMATWVNNIVSDFNRDTKIKKYKIDAVKKKMILSLLRSPEECQTILALHYDCHRHHVSGRVTLNDFGLLLELKLTYFFAELVVAPLGKLSGLKPLCLAMHLLRSFGLNILWSENCGTTSFLMAWILLNGQRSKTKQRTMPCKNFFTTYRAKIIKGSCAKLSWCESQFSATK